MDVWSPIGEQFILWVDQQLLLTVSAAEPKSCQPASQVYVLEPNRKLKWITAVLKPKEILLFDLRDKNSQCSPSAARACVNWPQRLLAASRLSCTGTMRSPMDVFLLRVSHRDDYLNCLQEIKPSSLHWTNHIQKLQLFALEYNWTTYYFCRDDKLKETLVRKHVVLWKFRLHTIAFNSVVLKFSSKCAKAS